MQSYFKIRFFKISLLYFIWNLFQVDNFMYKKVTWSMEDEYCALLVDWQGFWLMQIYFRRIGVMEYFFHCRCSIWLHFNRFNVAALWIHEKLTRQKFNDWLLFGYDYLSWSLLQLFPRFFICNSEYFQIIPWSFIMRS